MLLWSFYLRGTKDWKRVLLPPEGAMTLILQVSPDPCLELFNWFDIALMGICSTQSPQIKTQNCLDLFMYLIPLFLPPLELSSLRTGVLVLYIAMFPVLRLLPGPK